MPQTAEIIDLASYRKSRQAPASAAEAMPVMGMAPFAWVPVWIMVPMALPNAQSPR